MLDMNTFRENAELIRADHDKRGLAHDSIDEVLRLDGEWKDALHEQSEARRQRNVAAKAIAEAKKSGDQQEVDRIMSQVKDLGTLVDSLDEKANALLQQR